jgi:hypothetical protein
MNENTAARFWSFIVRKRSSIEVIRIVVSLSTIVIGITGLFLPQAVENFTGLSRISNRGMNMLLFLSLENISAARVIALIFICLGLMTLLLDRRLILSIWYWGLAFAQGARMAAYYAGNSTVDASDFSVGAMVVQILFALVLIL